MIQLIVGAKGKGKTKHLLEKVNNAVKTVDGNIVYLDKNAKHMYELKNRIRLINTSEFPFTSTDEFIGFLCGIVSQDHDLQELAELELRELLVIPLDAAQNLHAGCLV